jgi:hypothetical protein
VPHLRTDHAVEYLELHGSRERLALESRVLVVEGVEDVGLGLEETLLFGHVLDDLAGCFDDVLVLHLVDLLLLVVDLLGLELGFGGVGGVLELGLHYCARIYMV